LLLVALTASLLEYDPINNGDSPSHVKQKWICYKT